MKSIIELAAAISILTLGGPKLVEYVHNKVRKFALEQISKPMTPMYDISRALTEGRKMGKPTKKGKNHRKN